MAALNQKATLPPGWTWALPTEARWEYACRAGTTTAFSFGDTLKESQARFDGTFPYQNALPSSKPARPMPAGLCEGNAWGLLGMHGNVYEWCQDAWDGSSPFPGGRDPAGTTGKYRVIRGGSWNHGAVDCRSANRNGAMPEGRSNTLSFRVAVILCWPRRSCHGGAEGLIDSGFSPPSSTDNSGVIIWQKTLWPSCTWIVSHIFLTQCPSFSCELHQGRNKMAI